MRDLREINLNQTGIPVPKSAPSDEVIFEFESEFNLQLPEDYIKLLKHCNGGGPEVHLIDPVGGSALAGEGVDHFFHLDEDRQDLEGIWSETRVWRRRLGDKAVPIADDGCGNVFYLDLTTDPAKVMFCDHDQNFATFEVAPSFGDFIDSLRFDPDMT